MNLIFGKENLATVDEKYTVLELDTVRIMPLAHETTVYCLVDNVPIQNLSRLENMKELHNNLIKHYRNKQWDYCQQALGHLFGFWGPEMDTFYDSIKQRIDDYIEHDPGTDWDGIIEKQVIS